MERLVVIIDVMPEYGMRLAKYLNGSRTFPYRAIVFSEPAETESYIKNGGVYAIIIAEELEKDVLALVAGTGVKMFLLGETEEKGHRVLCRYASAKEIEACLTETVEPGKKIPVIGFFSPAGGVVTERLSRKIGEGLGKEGKVLFLSLFPFGIYGREWEDGFSEAVYYCRQGDAVTQRLQTLLRREEKMDCVGPARWYTDLNGVTKEDVEALLCGDVWDEKYKAFFVAVGQFDTTGKDVLNCCDIVLVPVWETEEGHKIAEEFRRQLKESGETKIYSGIREFPLYGDSEASVEKAVTEAVKKGGEVIEGDYGGDSQANFGASGFVRGVDR